jgi:ABC-2 type transport system ATP-binding protein
VFGVDVAREPHRIRQLVGVTGQLQGLRSADARAAAKRVLG